MKTLFAPSALVLAGKINELGIKQTQIVTILTLSDGGQLVLFYYE